MYVLNAVFLYALQVGSMHYYVSRFDFSWTIGIFE